MCYRDNKNITEQVRKGVNGFFCTGTYSKPLTILTFIIVITNRKMMPGQLTRIRVSKLSTEVAAFNVTVIGIKDLKFAFSCDT